MDAELTVGPRHAETTEERAEYRVADVETSYGNDDGEDAEADDERGIVRVGVVGFVHRLRDQCWRVM